MSRSAWLQLAGLGVLILLVVLAAVFGKDTLGAFRDRLNSVDRTWGLVLLALAYTPASLFLFPASILTLTAAVLFPVEQAVVAVSLGSTLAAAVVFLVGRGLARPWVEARVANSPRFRALDQAVAEQGFKIVFLTRLSPVFPYTLLNYVYGLTRVPFRHYVLASWVGMLPGTLLYVFLGSSAKGLAVLLSDLAAGRVVENYAQFLFLVVGLAATIAVTVLITRLARRSLDRALASREQPHDGTPSSGAG
jgi:uncharacterized membrane protein YdjX (TVP38/TMEM64 family)